MDVKYIVSDWEKTKRGIGDLIGLGVYGKGMIDDLKKITRNLDDVESLIRRYDSDGYVSFQHNNQENKIQQLFEDFKELHRFTGKVGSIVDDVIDQRFYEDIDAFVEAIRDLRIEDYRTTNRIGATETIQINTDYAPSGSIERTKEKITLNDLFTGDSFYADQIKLEYNNLKEMYPDQDFSLEDYQQVALNTHAFEYTSIKDQQYNKEFWVNIAALVVIVGTALICPPAGIALGAVYGTLELSTAATGRDWVSSREIDTGERWFRGALAPLDIIPGVSAVKKFSTAGRVTQLHRASDLGLQTFQKGQQIKQTIGNTLNRTKLEGTKRLKEAKNFAVERSQAVGNKLKRDIADAGQLAKEALETIGRTIDNVSWNNQQMAFASGSSDSMLLKNTPQAGETTNIFRSSVGSVKDVGGKGTGKGKGVSETNLRNIEDFINGNKKFDEVIEDYAKVYKEHVDLNKPWSWDDTIPGGDSLSSAQKRKIKEMAIEKGHIPEIKVTKADGMRYGFADFASAGVVEETVQLPERFWKLSDKEQFKWLDEQIGGTRKGMTWHHTEVPGKMELVPFGIHNITPHNGGRTKGMWADAPR